MAKMNEKRLRALVTRHDHAQELVGSIDDRFVDRILLGPALAEVGDPGDG